MNKKDTVEKIVITIAIIGIILFWVTFIVMLFDISNDDNYKCYWTTRGYICVFGSDKE